MLKGTDLQLFLLYSYNCYKNPAGKDSQKFLNSTKKYATGAIKMAFEKAIEIKQLKQLLVILQ